VQKTARYSPGIAGFAAVTAELSALWVTLKIPGAVFARAVVTTLDGKPLEVTWTARVEALPTSQGTWALI
jgi:hypothetical protein